jgi:hypothetical protein
MTECPGIQHGVMLDRVSRAVVMTCVVLTLAVGAVASAGASGDGWRREGSCTGHSDWRLEVDRRDANTLEVRFRIEHTPADATWEVFLSDNGHRFFAATRTSTSDGELRVRRNTRDRSGTDHVKGYGYSRATGEVCSGSVPFDH